LIGLYCFDFSRMPLLRGEERGGERRGGMRRKGTVFGLFLQVVSTEGGEGEKKALRKNKRERRNRRKERRQLPTFGP